MNPPPPGEAKLVTEILTSHASGGRIGDYIIEAEIGRGGMGVVYRAHKADTGEVVALKLMLPELVANPEFRERFVREAELGPNLDHPNIVPIFDSGEADGQLFIAMRLVEGRDLKELIKEEGPLEPARALRIFRQAAAALDCAHEAGVVHLDVKPQNILIAHDDETDGDVVYISDFGLVRPVGSESHASRTGQILGSIQYMSPEVVEGQPADGRADVYSLGCVLYEALTGKIPFDRPNEVAVLWAHVHEDPPRVTAARPHLPGGLDGVVGTALAKHPDDRFLTCGELALELEKGSGRKHRPVVMPLVRPLVKRAPRRKTEREVWGPNYFPELSRVRRLTDRTNWIQVVATTVALSMLAAAFVQFAHPQGLDGAVASVGDAVAGSVKDLIERGRRPAVATDTSDRIQPTGREARGGLRPAPDLRSSAGGTKKPDSRVVAVAATEDRPPTSVDADSRGQLPANGRIVFSSDRAQPENYDLFLTSRGRDLIRLTSGTADEWNPEWSPDGSKIMFTGCHWNPYCDIYTVRPDGTGLRRLTTNRWSVAPSWSPDGSKIVYTVVSNGRGAIYVMNSDGSGVRRLTDDLRPEGDPTWSPDGRQIAFERGGDIYVMKPDGSGIRPLLATSGYEGVPYWSPDGKKLCFQSTRDGDLDIWVMSSDGKTVTKITDDGPRDPLDDFWCNWSTDGKLLAYTSGPDGASGVGGKIFISDADGSNERLFMLGGVSDFDPDWEPLREPS